METTTVTNGNVSEGSSLRIRKLRFPVLSKTHLITHIRTLTELTSPFLGMSA